MATGDVSVNFRMALFAKEGAGCDFRELGNARAKADVLRLTSLPA
jgi:hypothetical protein